MRQTGMPHDTVSTEDLEILRRRAKTLDRTDFRSATNLINVRNHQDVYLCFRLLHERYGLPLKSVLEVIPVRNIVQVPRVPEHICGLVRLRGKVLTLVDLRRFWHGSATGYADSDIAVLVREGRIEVGFVCTEVENLIRISSEEIKELPHNMPAHLTAGLRGLYERDIMIISPSALIQQPGFVISGNTRK